MMHVVLLLEGMKNSGLSSVGHLLDQRLDEDIRTTLRHFCTVLTANLGENLTNKSSVYWMFDQVPGILFGSLQCLKRRYSDQKNILL